MRLLAGIALTAGLSFSAGGAAATCIGFASVRSADPSRTFTEGTGFAAARPIDYAVWFPTENCSGTIVTLGALATVAAQQQSLPTTPVEAAWRAALGTAADAIVSPAFADEPTGSHAEPLDRARSGPLVVYVHVNALEASTLAAALAARGYRVITLTWRGTLSQEFDVGGSGLMTEVLDAAAALRDFAQRTGTDVRRFDVIGTSFGAMTAACWRGLDPRIARIVSLDGGIGTRSAEILLPRCPYLMTGSLDVPVLHLHDPSHPTVTLGFARWLFGAHLVAEPLPLLQHGDYHATGELRRRFVESEAADPARSEQFARMILRVQAWLDEP